MSEPTWPVLTEESVLRLEAARDRQRGAHSTAPAAPPVQAPTALAPARRPSLRVVRTATPVPAPAPAPVSTSATLASPPPLPKGSVVLSAREWTAVQRLIDSHPQTRGLRSSAETF